MKQHRGGGSRRFAYRSLPLESARGPAATEPYLGRQLMDGRDALLRVRWRVRISLQGVVYLRRAHGPAAVGLYLG